MKNKKFFDKFYILGHRGFSENYPENTMLSFRACSEIKGVDGVELDVHLCKSGQVVVAHDGNLKRCAGIDRFIEDMNWEELKDIDVGSFKDSKFSNARMPLLTELFEEMGDRFFYDVEIKVEPGRPYKELCEKTWKIICDYKLEDKVMVSSFHPFALRYFNKVCKKRIPTADIFDSKFTKYKYLAHGFGHYISHSSYLKPDYDQCNEKYTRSHKLACIPWTVNDTEIAQQLCKTKGVRGLIGNNPQMLAQVFSDTEETK